MFEIEDIRAQWAKQRPDIDTGPMGTIGRVVRLSALYSEAMSKTFAKHGLSAASFDVLATLLRSGAPHELSPSQLLATMMVTSGTMTNRIDQLESEGLVTRVPNPQDQRSVRVKLTARGMKKIDTAVTDHVIAQKRLVKGLSELDQSSLNGLLDKCLSSFENR